MAKIYPDSQHTRVVFASSAEEQIYRIAKTELPDPWRVYYSCVLSDFEKDEGLKDNEIDFLFYHPRYGLVVLEVKGGRISFDGQQFSSINRFGKSFVIKDPFQQSLAFKSRLIRFLKKRGIRTPVSHGVSFPDVMEEEFHSTSAHNQDLIFGRSKLAHLAQSLQRLVEQSQPQQYLDFEDVGSALDEALVGNSFVTKLYLKDYIDGHELRVRDMETIHETLITPIASCRRLGLEGEAGTGKTMLAVLLAKHFRDRGQSVLLLTSNALLNLLISGDLGKGIEVQTYTELGLSFGVNLLIPPQEFVGERDDWVQYEAPDRLHKAILASNKRFDVMICDEAQDVQPFWWEPLGSLNQTSGSPLLLDDNQNPIPEETTQGGRLYVFFDSSQGVFGSGGHSRFVASEVLPIPPPYFPLVHNYRTTREIATFSRSFRTSQGVLQSHCGRLGYIPELITYKDHEDARRKLAELVQRLVHRESLFHNQITLLSARNPGAKESMLYQIDAIGKAPIHRFTSAKKTSWQDAKPPLDSLGISTIAAFKGLETPIGILINLSEYKLPADHPIMASLIYVACTRAKHMLYIMVQEDDDKQKAFAKALTSIKSAGTLTLEGPLHDFELVGKITHWNPERLGWLAVEESGFKQGGVMFFPHDIRNAGLPGVKVGDQLKFRPRIEGFLTIAADLKLP
jgi:hypothetical protein